MPKKNKLRSCEIVRDADVLYSKVLISNKKFSDANPDVEKYNPMKGREEVRNTLLKIAHSFGIVKSC